MELAPGKVINKTSGKEFETVPLPPARQAIIDAGGLITRPAAATAPRVRDVHQVEREAVIEAIAACEGNLASAARQLGISRMTLYRWMARYGIKRDPSHVTI